jgi:hypothetical protein
MELRQGLILLECHSLFEAAGDGFLSVIQSILALAFPPEFHEIRLIISALVERPLLGIRDAQCPE